MNDGGIVLQRTVAREAGFAGVALHDGRRVAVTLRPLDADGGVVFRRVDLGGVEVAARAGNVCDTRLATTLRDGDAEVGMVEHLLSALAALGVDNLMVDVDGPEMPALDGSAEPWMLLLLSACGLRMQNKSKKFIRVKKEVCVEDGAARAAFSPNEGRARYDVEIDFSHPVVRRSGERFQYTLHAPDYEREVGRARTFCYVNDVELMRKNKRALGGSLGNAVVYDDRGVLNEGGLRYADEFVRHKMLDVIGDCYVNARLILADYRARRPGHGVNNKLVRALLADAQAWEWVEEKARPREGVAAAAAPVFVPA